MLLSYAKTNLHTGDKILKIHSPRENANLPKPKPYKKKIYSESTNDVIYSKSPNDINMLNPQMIINL
jgi:hypothetical protein